MDNVTHSLAGLVLAEAAVQLRARKPGNATATHLRSVAAVSSMIAANLPDSDLVYTGIGGDRLAYMLHHRGHTHTVVVAILGAMLLWAAVMLASRWRGATRLAPKDRRWLFALLLVSTLGHLALDWTNSYGIHPFWPIDNRWRYGDSVFIVEPWFWAVSIPMLVAAGRSRLERGLLSAILLIGLALAWRVDLVAKGAAAALTIGAALFVVLARALRPGGRATLAIGAWIAVTVIMASGSSLARATALRAARGANPGADILDVVVTPLPTNPVCTTVITIERTGGIYHVATARVSAAPSLIDVSHCRSRVAPVPCFAGRRGQLIARYTGSRSGRRRRRNWCRLRAGAVPRSPRFDSSASPSGVR